MTNFFAVAIDNCAVLSYTEWQKAIRCFLGDGLMNNSAPERQMPASLEENLKKATTELMILRLFSEREHYIGELSAAICEKSGGVLSVVFPYAAIYRLQEGGYIRELPRRIAPDGRRRQYFAITEKGLSYFEQLCGIYRDFTEGVARILEEGEI